jgi:hypothetical protein
MTEYEFRRAISTDSAPQGSHCEWCGESAIFRLIAIGGLSHNESGLFCRVCGDKFAQAVAQVAPNASMLNYHAR